MNSTLLHCLFEFRYEENILKILSLTIGAYHLENLLDKIDVSILQAILDKYAINRNKAAHTHTAGTTLTYDAPSVVLNDFRHIKTIIATMENEIQSLP